MQVHGYEDDSVRISVKENPHPDRFEILFDAASNVISVKRTDSPEGWGQNLELLLLHKASGKTRSVSFGPSEKNEASMSLAPNENIPKVIRLCYKTKKIPDFVFKDLSELNPGYDIQLSDDEDCRQFIGDAFGGFAAECFSKIPNGSIRADFWRVCALNKLGGVYFDIDVRHRVSIDDYLLPETTFLTSTSVTPRHMNPIVLACAPGSNVLEMCAESYLERFRRRLEFDYWGWSICGTMFRALKRALGREINNDFNDILRHDDQVYQFVNEDKSAGFRGGYFTHWRGKRILDNHHNMYVESHKYKGFKEIQKPYEDENYIVEVEEHPYSDIFKISVEGRFITVTRTDEDEGWGQNLMLKVTRKSTGHRRSIEVGPSSKNGRRVEVSEWRTHASGSKSPKMLVVIAGEAFRHGQHGRERDTPESIEPQRKASMSHVALMDHIKSVWGLECDVMLSSYRTRHENKLLDWYGDRLVASSFKTGLVGLEPLVRDALAEAALEKYESLFVVRVDIELKDYFKEVFDPGWDKIMFPSICWSFQGYLTAAPHWVPRVSDTMEFVPKRLMSKVNKSFHLRHEAWHLYTVSGLSNGDLGLMLDTFHDSDSAKDYNPLYRMACRNDSKKWYSPNVVVGPNRSPVRCVEYIGYPDWKQPLTEPYEDDDILVAYQYDCYLRPEKFRIGVDKESESIILKRVDSDGGWDFKVVLMVKDKRTGEDREVFVGKSGSNEKTVPLDYRADRFENEEFVVTVKEHEFQDRFHLELDGAGAISVMRIDELKGWAQNLNLLVRQKSSGRSKIINVGPSQQQRKTVGFNFAPFVPVVPKRVALCLRGAVSRLSGPSKLRGEIYKTPRKYVDYRAVADSIKRHIIGRNDKSQIDVFLHSWSLVLAADMEYLYRPVASMFEDNETYADEILDRCEIPEDFSGVSHALSCKRVIQMKEEYERRNEIKYDMVVLYRPDTLLWKDMDFASYDVSQGVFVNAHPGCNGHFHFVMSSADASLFKGLYDSALKGNKYKVHQWIRNYVENYMGRHMIMDDIVPGRDQEVARPDKIKSSLKV